MLISLSDHDDQWMFFPQDTISVHRPNFYAQRFLDFMSKTVFRKITSRKFFVDLLPFQLDCFISLGFVLVYDVSRI